MKENAKVKAAYKKLQKLRYDEALDELKSDEVMDKWDEKVMSWVEGVDNVKYIVEMMEFASKHPDFVFLDDTQGDGNDMAYFWPSEAEALKDIAAVTAKLEKLKV